jgi:pimeloyl-ACP methyl ester carboxylesterase
VARGSGHSVYWEKPDEFNETVMRFLAKIDGLEAPLDWVRK